MTLRHLKGLIFDVDGTLVDSNELHVQAWVDAFREFRVDMPADKVRPHIGKGGDLLVPDLLDARSMRRFGDDLKNRRSDIFRSRYLPRVRPFPGASEALRKIGDSGLALAMASSSDEEEVEHYRGLLGEVPVTATTSKADASYSKPSPEIFDAAREKLGMGDAVVVVGDTPYDILAAHRIAVPVIAVRSGGFPDEALGGAEFLTDSVRDIPSMLERLDDWFATI